MGIVFEIRYHELVVKHDIPKLSTSTRKRIRTAIESKLTEHPEKFGKPLRRSIKGYRKLRVGDHRVIFAIENRLIKILIIGHRSEVYKNTEKRLG